MKIRATILFALIVVLGLSSGASAYYEQIITLDPERKDTTEFLNLPTTDSLLNDTISFVSGLVGVSHDYQYILGRITQARTDTLAAIGLFGDSVYFVLQGKSDRPVDSAWHTLWTSSLVPQESFDSTDGWVRGDAMRIYVPPDSIGRLWNQFRVQYYVIAEEDSIRSLATLAYTSDPDGDSSSVDVYRKWEVYLSFREGDYSSNLSTISTQIRDTLEALKNQSLQYEYNYTLSHLARSDTAGTAPITLPEGYYDWWVIIDELVGDTLVEDSLIWTLEHLPEYGGDSTWAAFYVRTVMDADSSAYPVSFYLNTADSICFDKIRVKQNACPTCDTAWTDSGAAADSGFATYSIRVIGKRR